MQLTEWYYIIKMNDAIPIDTSHILNAFIIHGRGTHRRTWAECPCDNDWNNNITLDIHHLIPLKRQHWHFNCDYSDDDCIIVIVNGRFFRHLQKTSSMLYSLEVAPTDFFGYKYHTFWKLHRNYKTQNTDNKYYLSEMVLYCHFPW